jgi:hypothetical protein
VSISGSSPGLVYIFMMSPIDLSGPMPLPRRWLRVKRRDTARTVFLRAALAFISVY